MLAGMTGCSRIAAIAQRLDRHVEHEPHPRGIALGELPGLGVGEIAVRLGDDVEDRADVEMESEALHMPARFADQRIGAREHREIVRRRLGLAPVGRAPPQFLAIIVSERCARLPRSLARSALMRCDDRLVRIIAVLPERHFAQEEIAHRIDAVGGDEARRARRHCRPTSTSSRRG